MATRKTPKAKPLSLEEDAADASVQPVEAGVEFSPSAEAEAVIEASAEPVGTGEESSSEEANTGATNPSLEPAAAGPGAAIDKAAEKQGSGEHTPRFHFFVIDAGWKTESAKVLRENFRMIREFQNSDPLYVLTREQSVALIRANPDLIGKDPIILVHDLHAQGGQGESGYHGFRLCLGLLKDGPKALASLLKFLRFVQHHRHSPDIEKAIREQLHRKGLEGAIEVIREGASAMME
jgi:hypothetical protein